MLSAWEVGDFELFLSHIAPDAEWMPSVWSGGGTYHGHEGLRRWAKRLTRPDRSVEFHALEYRDGPAGVAVIGEIKRLRAGREYASPLKLGWVFEVEDGRVIRGEGFSEPDRALRLAGLWPPG